MQKVYCGRGLSLHVFYTSETDIWVKIGRGKVGLSGNIQVKIIYSKTKFDNVFDIRMEYCLYIQKYEENPFAGFFNTTIVGKIFGNF